MPPIWLFLALPALVAVEVEVLTSHEALWEEEHGQGEGGWLALLEPFTEELHSVDEVFDP